MLAEAVRAKVDAYLAAFADEHSSTATNWSCATGHHPLREVLTSAGAVQVTALRINDKRVDPGAR